jgi:hypothetical protein
MRIATWNVQRPADSSTRARLAEYIERINADVWVLTDTPPGLRPGARHASVHTAESATHPGFVGAAIWSKHPIRALTAADPLQAVAAAITLPDGSELIVYGTAHVAEAHRAEWLHLRREHPAAEFCVAGQSDAVAALEPAFIDAQLACVTQGHDDPVAAQSGGERSATGHIALSADLAERVSGRGSWPAGTEPLRELSAHFGLYVDIE